MKTSTYGFATFFKPDGLYYFQLYDAEGSVILYSKGYQSEKSRDNGIQSVIRSAKEDQHYEFRTTKKGQHFFILKAGNRQEIGRSRMFDTKEEMKEKIELLKKLDENVPVFEAAVSTEKEGTTESPKGISLQVDEPPLKKEKVETGSVPRHKFSVIYYPESNIWTLKHELSGNSKQLQTCDGRQIEEFLRSQVLSGQQKAAMPSTVSGTAMATDPAQTGVPHKLDKKAQEEVEMKIQSLKGEIISHFFKAGHLAQIEVIPPSEKTISDEIYEAKVTAKSFEENKKIIVGEVKGQTLTYGRMLIPIYEANKLKPGMYRFTVTIHQGKEGEDGHDYTGSRLVMLN